MEIQTVADRCGGCAGISALRGVAATGVWGRNPIPPWRDWAPTPRPADRRSRNRESALRLDALGNPPRTGGAEGRGKGSRRAGRPSLRCRRSARIDGDEKKTARSKHCGPYPIGRRIPASFSRLVPRVFILSEFFGYAVDAVHK